MKDTQLVQAVTCARKRLDTLPVDLLIATARSAGEFRGLAGELRQLADDLDTHADVLEGVTAGHEKSSSHVDVACEAQKGSSIQPTEGEGT
ncbi:hypothetical protein ACIQUM_31780 [Amycolatopsis azurea]|uniref:hypothetical protein n=1 Tax=Amycolatopsis azurea TaxID=36819 RepID=UPI00380BD332